MASFTNPIASFTSDTFLADSLIQSRIDDILSRKITLVSGQNLSRGALLGRVTVGTATSAAKAGGNTGNGTLVMDATTPVLANASLSGPGVYTVRCTVAAANAATFEVVDPRGVAVGTLVSFSGSGASVTFATRLKFAITDGATDFVVGDGFDITLAAGAVDGAGNYKYKLCAAAAVDGSATPDCILYGDTNATSGDTLTIAYKRGRFNQNSLSLGAGITITDDVIEGLRMKGIDLISIVAA